MDPDALLHPRGPLPPAVYWRRRGLTLLAVVVVLFVIRSCTAGGEPTDRVAQTPAPSAPVTTPPPKSARPSAKPSATASPATTPPVRPCRAADLVVSAQADAQAYPAGRRPVLTIGIANKGTAPCTRDVGQAARQIVVTSGNDRVWSSDDCSPGGGSQQATLVPGAAPTTFTVTWARRRSAPGCPSGLREVTPGTYRVTGRFGDLTSTGDTFTLG